MFNLKNIKSMIWEDVNESSNIKTQNEKNVSSEISNETIQKEQSASLSNSSGTFNEELFNTLVKAIEDNNIQGYDYLEFKEAVRGLRNSGLTEKQQYETIYQVAKTTGSVTVNSFTDSIKFYLGVLEKEKEKFQNAISDQTKEQITKREELITSNEQTIVEMQEQISQLNTDIQAKQQENIQLLTEKTESGFKIGNAQSSFDITFNRIIDAIKEDEEKIIRYLSSTTETEKTV